MTSDEETVRSWSEEIDETATVSPSPDLGLVTTYSYDPQQRLDSVRSRLAFCLVGIFAITIIGAFVLVMAAPTVGLAPDHVRIVVEILITPTVSLVSAATGFYFGSQLSGRRARRR